MLGRSKEKTYIDLHIYCQPRREYEAGYPLKYRRGYGQDPLCHTLTQYHLEGYWFSELCACTSIRVSFF